MVTKKKKKVSFGGDVGNLWVRVDCGTLNTAVEQPSGGTVKWPEFFQPSHLPWPSLRSNEQWWSQPIPGACTGYFAFWPLQTNVDPELPHTPPYQNAHEILMGRARVIEEDRQSRRIWMQELNLRVTRQKLPWTFHAVFEQPCTEE